MAELKPGPWHVVRWQEGWGVHRVRPDLGPNIVEHTDLVYALKSSGALNEAYALNRATNEEGGS